MITAANHTGFTVSDVERSVAFYRDVLGLELLSLAERDPGFSARISGIPGAHMKTAYLRTPDGHRVELIQYLSPPGQALDMRTSNAGNGHLALNVDDLRALYARLKSQGVAFKSEPLEIPGGPNRGNLAVYCTDPDGITIELIQPKA
jgi:catechol 2,3-dioxygenase-like lactoylglutathione lyase family enzyme